MKAAGRTVVHITDTGPASAASTLRVNLQLKLLQCYDSAALPRFKYAWECCTMQLQV